MTTIQVKGKTVSTVTVEDNTESLNGKTDVPLLLSFPHSGELYPDDFETNPELPFEILDFPNDKYVDELYQARSELNLISIQTKTKFYLKYNLIKYQNNKMF